MQPDEGAAHAPAPLKVDPGDRRLVCAKLAEMLTANQAGDAVTTRRVAHEIGIEGSLAILLKVTKSLMGGLAESGGFPVESIIAALAAGVCEGAQAP